MNITEVFNLIEIAERKSGIIENSRFNDIDNELKDWAIERYLTGLPLYYEIIKKRLLRLLIKHNKLETKHSNIFEQVNQIKSKQCILINGVPVICILNMIKDNRLKTIATRKMNGEKLNGKDRTYLYRNKKEIIARLKMNNFFKR